LVITVTSRLTLRHFHTSDKEALDRLFGDADVMRFGPGVQTPEWVGAWLDARLNDYHKWGFGRWALVENSSREFVGYCGLNCLSVEGQPETEIGYRLLRPFWGHGYATEAATAVRDYTFNKLRLPRFIALVDPQNIASLRVVEKIGMHYEKDAMLPDYTHPDRVYAMSRQHGA